MNDSVSQGSGTGGLVRLSNGALKLDLAAQVGGAIASFTCGGVPVMRGSGVPARALDAACFPLVPYSNRIRGGRFAFRRREVSIAPNMPGDPSPLHGQGWLAQWEVVSSGEAQAELRFHHEPGEWPWAYEARQHFALGEDRLDVTLACRNLSDEPMPCGLGLHPYFHCTPQTRLDTKVHVAWTIDDKVLPVEKVPAQGRYDLRDRLVCGQGLDNGFGGWGGTARMETPGAPFAVEMSSADARFFQLYSPASGGIYVAEPVSHANAALNAPEEEWPELGLRVLAPGAEMRLSATFRIVAR